MRLIPKVLRPVLIIFCFLTGFSQSTLLLVLNHAHRHPRLASQFTTERGRTPETDSRRLPIPTRMAALSVATRGDWAASASLGLAA
jgi:hypothetical protein